jgi:hypothetical protein
VKHGIFARSVAEEEDAAEISDICEVSATLVDRMGGFTMLYKFINLIIWDKVEATPRRILAVTVVLCRYILLYLFLPHSFRR